MLRGQIAIALPKGRLLPEAIKLFEATGIEGLEGLMESRRLLCEDVTGAYRFMGLRPGGFSSVRVATKYPKLAERYFAQQGVQVEIIRLSGSIELAPLVGLSERIVDLVDTGRTLQENDLEEVEEIATATARLIVNRAALKTKHQKVRGPVDGLRAVEQGGRA